MAQTKQPAAIISRSRRNIAKIARRNSRGDLEAFIAKELTMRRVLLLLPASLLLVLAGCAGNYPDYPGGARYSANTHRYYRVAHNGNETDYVMDRVLFPTDSARISPNAYEMVADIAADARNHPRTSVFVEGYTDTTGSAEHNQDLSNERADAVADVLARHGIARSRIATHGFGERRLAVPTGNGVEEAANRRVVIRIVAG